jgi:hypothetical protein
MAGLRVFSGGACIVLGGGGSSGTPLPPAVNPTITDQSTIERAFGLPQLYNVVVSYEGILKLSMGVQANALDQQQVP